ncbi:MAG: aminotransferase class I/II-fold pyridoxal phosphate-dependent enzyme [Ectobacillus sp.]
MNQYRTPLYDALVCHANKRSTSFHVPGHKNGIYFPEKAQSHFSSVLEIDVTELTGLDDLHDASGCIQEAENLLADLYGVQRSRFLVNGSTVGNLAMVFAVCKENDIVLVQRNCHKSIINGLQLVGVRPVFLSPFVDESTNVSVGVKYETVQAALDKYPEAKAIILTHPNYYGMAYNLKEIIALAHQKGIPVLVDEAHGAHFCLGSPFPKSAIEYGADIVVHSAHKTLPAMTMGSYLHINSTIVEAEKVSLYLSMLQSSSPSYPIMASLDLARFSLANLKNLGIEESSAFLHNIKEELRAVPQIKVIDSPMQDPLRIILQTKCSLSGYELQKLLEQEGIYTEMADPYNVLLMLPLEPQKRYTKAPLKIKRALEHYPEKDIVKIYDGSYKIHEAILPYGYKELDRYKTAVLPMHEAKGYVCAEMPIPYPPGIPLIMKGEIITGEHINQFQALLKSGARFQGSVNIEEGKIKIYKAER